MVWKKIVLLQPDKYKVCSTRHEGDVWGFLRKGIRDF